eukprot:12512262-Alexandrium_andersonii.AAC.1
MDVQLFSNRDHWTFSQHMIHRITKRQQRLGIRVDDPRWVLAGLEMRPAFFDDLDALVVDPWEIR